MQSLLPHQRSSRDRTTFFMILIMSVLFIQIFLTPPQKKPDIDQPIAEQKEEKTNPDAGSGNKKEPPAVVPTRVEPQYITLGSLNPKPKKGDDEYRMLITLTNRGAAVSRIELNTPQYRDVQEQSGYMGQVVVDESTAATAAGLTLQVVGKGTPADIAGLAAGDVITAAYKKNSTHKVSVKTAQDLRDFLRQTKPKELIDVDVIRNGRKVEGIGIPLTQYPLDIIRPEITPKNYEDYKTIGGLRGISETAHQRSFLTTLQTFDDSELKLPESQQISNSGLKGLIPVDKTLGDELDGVKLRNENWEIVKAAENEAVFRQIANGMELTKTYTLSKNEQNKNAGYDFMLKIEVRNLDTAEHKVAYQLDGPTGLPLEGAWYARKQGPGWGQYGLRDIVVKFPTGSDTVFSNNEVHIDKLVPWTNSTPQYIGVDSLYFQCTMKPEASGAALSPAFSAVFPMRVGTKNTDWYPLTDVSFRLWSQPAVLKPQEKIEQQFTVFAGPKDTKVLAYYALSNTISYGWFWFAAIPLLQVLHFFHDIGLTYAMAIIALTIGVRLIIFPLSIKQAAGALKMQQIQPELKALSEKYKDDMHARAKAQGELFKKHNYHPASGCLPLLIQLPIFIGLYKALSVDAGLYATPLISSTVRWCSDLSAPDMLFDWSSWWVSWFPSFNTGQGMFTLGPYFNVLPMLTIALFLLQQHFMMPPPTDDQTRMQRTMMQWMMVFMGLLFFKIPSGLCIYFIISTLWGLLERRFIPKAPLTAANQTLDITSEPVKRKKPAETPKKNAGGFMQWLHDISEKASSQQKFEKSDKKKKKKK